MVGAGLAGLTVAREVARRGWSVAVLEANRVAWAASGRNTGFVLPGFHEDVDAMIERIGLDHTKQLWALSEQGVAYVRRTIEETGMPGVDPVDGWLHVSKTDDSGEAARAYVERLRWIGGEVEAWPTERVRERAAEPALFQRRPLSDRLPHPSAQLRARPGRRRRSGRRAHLRAHAGDFDRSHRRAQAHRHAARAACARRMWCSPAMSISAR